MKSFEKLNTILYEINLSKTLIGAGIGGASSAIPIMLLRKKIKKIDSAILSLKNKRIESVKQNNINSIQKIDKLLQILNTKRNNIKKAMAVYAGAGLTMGTLAGAAGKQAYFI